MKRIRPDHFAKCESLQRGFQSPSRRRRLEALAISVVGFAAVLLLAAAPARANAGSQDVLRATLPNGLRVVVVRNRLAPVVTTVMNYQAGSDQAPEGFPGMA